MGRLENGQKDPDDLVKFKVTASDGYVEQIALYEGWMLYPLTPCCKASVKGLQDCVGCRACYAEIHDPWYWMSFDVRNADQRRNAFSWLIERCGKGAGAEFDRIMKERAVS